MNNIEIFMSLWHYYTYKTHTEANLDPPVKVVFIDNWSRQALGQQQINELLLDYLQGNLKTAARKWNAWASGQEWPKLRRILVTYHERDGQEDILQITGEFNSGFSVTMEANRHYTKKLIPEEACRVIINELGDEWKKLYSTLKKADEPLETKSSTAEP